MVSTRLCGTSARPSAKSFHPRSSHRTSAKRASSSSAIRSRPSCASGHELEREQLAERLYRSTGQRLEEELCSPTSAFEQRLVDRRQADVGGDLDVVEPDDRSSAGIRMPSERAASMAPSAWVSDAAKIAVGRSGKERSSEATARATCGSRVPSRTKSLRARSPPKSGRARSRGSGRGSTRSETPAAGRRSGRCVGVRARRGAGLPSRRRPRRRPRCSERTGARRRSGRTGRPRREGDPPRPRAGASRRRAARRPARLDRTARMPGAAGPPTRCRTPSGRTPSQ